MKAEREVKQKSEKPGPFRIYMNLAFSSRGLYVSRHEKPVYSLPVSACDFYVRVFAISTAARRQAAGRHDVDHGLLQMREVLRMAQKLVFPSRVQQWTEQGEAEACW